jgi:hypothetical protein
MRNVAFSFNPVYIPLNPLLGAILDLGLRIADLLYRFALSFFIKLIRRRRTLNPNSKIQNPKFSLNLEPMNLPNPEPLNLYY